LDIFGRELGNYKKKKVLVRKMNKTRPTRRTHDVIIQYLKEKDQNITFAMIYTKDGW
jgi:hypothetical protein